MPTARCDCSSISHGSTVIVADGITCWDPWTMTRAVEVLHIKEDGWFTKSHWSVVDHLTHVVYMAIPLIVNDKLYIAVGHDKKVGASTCNIIQHGIVLYSRDRYEIIGLRKSSHSIKQPCSSICLKKAFAMHQSC